jgi:hypothetical protein
MSVGWARGLSGFAVLVCGASVAFSASKAGKSPLDELPAYIRQVTYFGQRADWSHDGKRILSLEKVQSLRGK